MSAPMPPPLATGRARRTVGWLARRTPLTDAWLDLRDLHPLHRWLARAAYVAVGVICVAMLYLERALTTAAQLSPAQSQLSAGVRTFAFVVAWVLLFTGGAMSDGRGRARPCGYRYWWPASE